jgi:asparagine synthase (glutamine-hydrolysing)
MVPIDRRLSGLRMERVFLGRHKFCHFRVWYRHELSTFVREMLLGRSAAVRNYVEPKALASVVESHTNGTGNWTTEIHKLLTIELIHRSLLDAKGA